MHFQHVSKVVFFYTHRYTRRKALVLKACGVFDSEINYNPNFGWYLPITIIPSNAKSSVKIGLNEKKSAISTYSRFLISRRLLK